MFIELHPAAFVARFFASNATLSFRDSRTQNLCPEESTLRLLNHLLVHALRWMVHHHSASLVVKLRVNSGVPDQVDNPLLAIFFG